MSSAAGISREAKLEPALVYVVFALLAASGCQPAPPHMTAIDPVGDPMADLEADYVQGSGPRTVAAARGGVLVLEFWTTYCTQCRRSFSIYEGLHRAPGVAVIAVSLDNPDDVAEVDLRRFADDAGVTFSVVWDREQSAISTYALSALPTTFVIDKRGVVAASTVDSPQPERPTCATESSRSRAND